MDITMREAAERLKYKTTASVKKALEAGFVKMRQSAGGVWLVDSDDVDAFLATHGPNPGRGRKKKAVAPALAPSQQTNFERRLATGRGLDADGNDTK